MARARAKSKPRSSKPRQPRLPMTKRTVTTRVQFGRFGATADVDSLLDQAFVAADDGDCSRVQKTLDRAEAAGANVGLHRKQLMQDCTNDRTGIAGLRVPGSDRLQAAALAGGVSFAITWALTKTPTFAGIVGGVAATIMYSKGK